MTTDPPPSAKHVFLDALERTEQERAAFLERACAGRPELRAQVAALLAAHERAGALELESLGRLRVDLQAGMRVGHYRLIELLGEGGFGVVWRALQEEPVRRDVALKVLKLGMDTEQVVRRFEAERQALALMDHPHIARVYEAGATERGRPYFAMELVRGLPITRYCDEHGLDLEERLQLFLAVCRAIQHAHQKGVVHRDLKPSNLLVTVQDGKAVPKVIDFGIAKAMRAEWAQRTLVTEHHQLIGTPEYMSPEQTLTGAQDVDTRTDVYSLGVVLYELLTGTLPFTSDGAAGRDELLRAIREAEPRRPSACPPRDGLGGVPAHRLRRLFRRDLDWIVMKALAKERARRYDTVGALAADVERFLRDEPVEASPPSTLYRLQKTVRRHRAAFLSLGAVGLALVLGGALAVTGFLEARRQARIAGEQEVLARAAQERAEEERDRANAVVGLLQRMLNAPWIERSLGPDYTVRELLDRFDAGLAGELERQPLVEATVRSTLGVTYLLLDLPRQARPHLERSLALHREHRGPDHPDTLLDELNYARLLAAEGSFEQAVRRYQAHLPALERSPAIDPRIVSITRVYLAVALMERGAYAEAEAALREAHDGVAEGDVLGLAVVTNNLGLLAERRADFPEAERLFREALRLHRQSGASPVEEAKSHSNLGNVLLSTGRLVEAEVEHRRSLELLESIVGGEDALTVRAHHNLGRVLTRLGRLDEAETHLSDALDDARRILGPRHPDVAAMTSSLALIHDERGDTERATAMSLAALELRRETLGHAHPQLAASLYNVGTMLRAQGQLGEAEVHLRESLEAVLADESGRPYRSRVCFELSHVREGRGDLEEALRLAGAAHAHALGVLAAADVQAARARANELAQRLGRPVVAARVLLDAGLPDDAEAWILDLLDEGATSPAERAWAGMLTGRLLLARGAHEEAESWLVDAYHALDAETDDPELRSETARAILALYEGRERPEELARWRAELGRAGLLER